jgi:hypothetical protein
MGSITFKQRRAERLAFLVDRISKTLYRSTDSLIHVGGDLSEIKRNKLWQEDAGNETSFYGWVSRSHKWGLSESKGRYLVLIHEKAKKLEIATEKLAPLGNGRLRHIFSLDVDKHKESIMALVESAHSMTAEQVQDAVRGVRKGKVPVIRTSVVLRFTKPERATYDKVISVLRGEREVSDAQVVLEVLKKIYKEVNVSS